MGVTLTDYEEKVRKIWLIGSIYAYLPVNIFYFVLIILASKNNLSQGMILFEFVKMIVWSCITILCFYQCAYKNPGTKLLFLNMIILPVSFILPFIYSDELTLLPTPIFIMVLQLPVFIFWFVLNYMLLKVNEQIQFKQIEYNELNPSPDYLLALKEFETTFTQEDLNLKFGSLVKDDGNLAREEAIIKAYKERQHFIKHRQI